MGLLTIYKSADPVAALILAHGAGAGQKSAWMVKTAKALADLGITSATFDFPYISAGRKAPDKAPVLEQHWRDVLDEGRRTFGALPLFIGGKSMGGRIATQVAAQGGAGVRGIVLFGYPLHPPGRPEQRRDAHLPQIDQPVLFIQGSSDPFGTEHEIRALMPSLKQAQLHSIRGGDHSFKVPGGVNAQGPAFDQVVSTAADWIRQVLKA